MRHRAVFLDLNGTLVTPILVSISLRTSFVIGDTEADVEATSELIDGTGSADCKRLLRLTRVAM